MLSKLFEHQYIFLLFSAILVNLFANTYRNRVLMYFLLIVSVLFAGQIFYEHLHGNTTYSLLKILFSSVYFGPVLYIYLLSIYNKSPRTNSLWKHFIFPVGLVVLMKILRLYFELPHSQILPYILIGSIIPFYYFYKGLLFIKSQSSNATLVAKSRFTLFYAITNVYILVSSAIFIVSLFYYTEVDFLVSFSTSVSGFYYSYIMQPLFIFFILMISLYALTEATWLREYIVRDTLVYNTKFKNDRLNKAFDVIDNDMISKKRYLESNLNIKSYSKTIGIDTESVNVYVANKKFKNFTSLLNFYRVREFKAKVNEVDSLNFTLSAIASECGFNSKSTFFRVFKDHENMTPKQYVDKIQKNK